MLHRLAILQGVKAECSTRLVEEIVAASIPEYSLTPTEQAMIDRYIKKQYLPSSIDYEVEQQVNHRLGLSLLDLIRVLETQMVHCGSTFQPKVIAPPASLAVITQADIPQLFGLVAVHRPATFFFLTVPNVRLIGQQPTFWKRLALIQPLRFVRVDDAAA